MAIFLRALCIGYGLAALAGLWIGLESGGWVTPFLAAWFGGAVLTLALALLGTLNRGDAGSTAAAARGLPLAATMAATLPANAEALAWAAGLTEETAGEAAAGMTAEMPAEMPAHQTA